MQQPPLHLPVLLQEVLDGLKPKAGESVFDGTLGLGGHAAAFLQAIGSNGQLIAVDADRDNLEIAREHLAQWSNQVVLHHANFSQIGELLTKPVDIIFADVGLSSPHLDLPERGFSFRADGPLDLRFDRSSGMTASDLIARTSEDDLAHLFRSYGELFKEARSLARLLAGKEIPTTFALRAMIEEKYTFRAKDLLPRVFQTLRIAVNDELAVLQRFLDVAPGMLKPGGRIGIISFHSLEDRLVKHAFRSLTIVTKDPITGRTVFRPPFEIRTKKPIVPSAAEIAKNPRARSAKFRIIERLPSP